ncbi:unnamed protein product [Moneuplotes crassus]|uniref:Uncharacterized protein n=1 Tax=Euplotes crassus TaxID=5936 RepID=A0AAD2D6F2_EUPCR|nr:unnamed protein product [Moneuplotes crassus]
MQNPSHLEFLCMINFRFNKFCIILKVFALLRFMMNCINCAGQTHDTSYPSQLLLVLCNVLLSDNESKRGYFTRLTS